MLYPLISWKIRNTSFRSASLKFREMRFPVYFCPVSEMVLELNRPWGALMVFSSDP